MTPGHRTIDCRSTPMTEPLDCFLGHRREEINKIAVRIAEQYSTIPPRHCGCGRFLYPLIDKRVQAIIIQQVSIIKKVLELQREGKG